MATRATLPEILTPAQVEDLIVLPVVRRAAATQVATTVRTNSSTTKFPRVVADPSAGWVAEGAEIPLSDVDTDEVTVTPSKLAALSVISRELADDSSPAAADIIGAGIARDLVRKVNAAFFGNLNAPAPSGLGGLSGITTVNAGTSWSSLDPFLDAAAAVEAHDTSITAFVANPADALILGKLKQSTGSQLNLLQPDPTAPSRRLVNGTQLLLTPDVPAGTIYGVPQDRAFIVIRQDASLDVDGSVFFTSDRVAIRSTLRIGFAFVEPAAIVRVKLTAA